MMILVISVHPTMFQCLCTRAVLNFQARGIRRLERVVTLPGALCIKDTSLLRTIQCGPMVSIIQIFHCSGCNFVGAQMRNLYISFLRPGWQLHEILYQQKFPAVQ